MKCYFGGVVITDVGCGCDGKLKRRRQRHRCRDVAREKGKKESGWKESGDRRRRAESRREGFRFAVGRWRAGGGGKTGLSTDDTDSHR